MNNLKILISIFLLGLFCAAKAQGTDKERMPTQNGELETLASDTTIQIFDLKINPYSVDEKILKNALADSSLTISIDSNTFTMSLTIDTEKISVSELQDRLQKKDYLLVPVPSDELNEKYDPRIDIFLNIQDTTIFTSRFERYDSSEVHPSRWEFYQVIQNIHDFSNNLKKCEYNISDSAIIENVKQENKSIDESRISLLKDAKQNLVEAEKNLEALLDFSNELSTLSISQKQFYRSLTDKLDYLYETVNRD